MDCEGEGEGGMIWENGIETCILLSYVKEITVQVRCMRQTLRDGVGREVGGGSRMGDTCTPMADSCQCMGKTTTVL